MKKGLIGSLLVQRGMLTAAQLEQAQALQRRSGGHLDEILIGMGMLTEAALQRCLAEISACVYYDGAALKDAPIDDGLLQAVSYRMAMTHLLLPLRRKEESAVVGGETPKEPGIADAYDVDEGACMTPSTTSRKTLVVAAQAPLTAEVKAGLLRSLDVDDIEICLSTRDDLLEAIRHHYGSNMAARATQRSRALSPARGSADHGYAQIDVGSSEDINEFALQREGFCPSCGTPFKEAWAPCQRCGRELDAAAIDPFVDRVLGSRWKLTRLLNHGGMGLIYQALDLETGKLAAVKLLRNQFRSSSVEIQRFNNEANILQRLRHPQIVETHEFGYEERLGFYLAMELLEGVDLYEYQFQLALPTSLLCEIFVQVCDAMAYAHSQGIIHRDLKPENIFLLGGAEQFEGVKIFDFGIAKLLEGHRHLTEPGVVMGTPEYIAPEQAKNGPVDHRTDIYALSVILYEFLCGERLFDAENAYAYLMKHVYAPVIPLASRSRRTIPLSLEQLVMRGLAKAPEGRVPTMLAYRNALIDIIEELEHMDELAMQPTRDWSASPELSYHSNAAQSAPATPSPSYIVAAASSHCSDIHAAEDTYRQERVPTRAIYGQRSGGQSRVSSSPEAARAVSAASTIQAASVADQRALSVAQRASQLMASGTSGLMQMVQANVPLPLPAHAHAYAGVARPFAAEPPTKSLSSGWCAYDSQHPEAHDDLEVIEGVEVETDPAAAPTIPEPLPGILFDHETMAVEAISPPSSHKGWWIATSIGLTALTCALLWTLFLA